MSQNKGAPRGTQPDNNLPVQVETLRNAATSGAAAPPKGEERLSIFWRVFGGTLLSIAALVVVTMCQHFNNQLNDLRSDLTHLDQDLRKDLGRYGEAQGELVKKEDLSSRMRYLWDTIQQLQGEKAAVTALKDRVATLQEQFRAGEEERKSLAREVQQLRERKAGEDGRRELVREVQQLRERLATLEGGQQKPPAVMPAAQGE